MSSAVGALDILRATARVAARAEGRAQAVHERDSILGGSVRDRAIRLGLEALARADLLWRFNFTVHGAVGGQPIAVPLLRGEGIQLIRGDERWLFELLRRLMGAVRGVFIDVGTNIGQTLIKVKALDRARPYYGFEPNPLACAYVRELVRANRFTNVSIAPIGLGTSPAVAQLFSKADTDPSASLVPGFRGAERYSSVQPASVLRGDEVLASLGVGRVALVKIDVEGGELDVLNGLPRVLAVDRPLVICEVLPTYDIRTAQGQFRRERQRALIALLRAFNYEIRRVQRDGALDSISDFGIHSDITRSNYVFIPAEQSKLSLIS